MTALLLLALVAQDAAKKPVAERYREAKAAFNDSEADRLQALHTAAGKRMRSSKGAARQRTVALMAQIRQRRGLALAGKLGPYIQVGDYAVGQVGYLVDDPKSLEPEAVPMTLLLHMDAIALLGVRGWKCTLGGETVIVDMNVTGQVMQKIALKSPVEVVGRYSDLGGTYWVLRAFTPPTDRPKAADAKAPAKGKPARPR